jgi:uncharacterized protein YggE
MMEPVMKRLLIVILACLLARPTLCRGQVGGNVSYTQANGRMKAEQSEHNARVLSKDELPPSATSTFVDAHVLMNAQAEQFVAVFGVVQEAETIVECNRKMDATIKQFTDDLKVLGVKDDDVFVDFIAQHRTFGFEVAGNLAKEKLVGFELKKNVSIRYREKGLLDKLVLTASRSQIFDLIKVDYIVTDMEKVDDRLMEEASRAIKKKASRYEKLLDLKLQPPAQIYAERTGMYPPTGMYDSYTAFETEHVASPGYREGLTTQSARKSRTFYYNPLDASGFDAVINPVIVEPVVQFTLYLKVKYEVAPVRAR